MVRLVFFVIGLTIVLCGYRVRAAETGEVLSAVITHRVHPVLLRKPECELGQLVIALADGAHATLEQLRISLSGTTELSDLESVQIFDTGARTEFSARQMFGERAPPAATIVIRGSKELSPGRNVFWIACRLRATAALDHRVQAECVEVQTSQGTIVPRSEGNRAGHRIGVALRQAGDDGVHTYRIPALATTSRGTLLCAYDIRRRSARDLQGDIDVGLSRSSDGGQNWEPMRVILDMGTYGGLPEEQNGVGDPGLVVDPHTGEIFVFALWVHGKPGKHQWQGDGSEPGFEIGQTAQFMVTRSTDDGLTWSAPENLTRHVKREEWLLFAPSPQQGIALRDGTLVMPVQGRDSQGPFATIMQSADHGRSWQVAPRAYSGGNECQAAELGDGTLMLNIRNDEKKRRAVMVSRDRGQTWQPHATHEQTLIEPTCNGSLYRWTVPNGLSKAGNPAPPLLLFANPQHQRKRIRHTILVSRDDGLTWPDEGRLLLDEGQGFGYPSLSRVDDDHVGIVYEGSQAHLVFQWISRRELERPAGGG